MSHDTLLVSTQPKVDAIAIVQRIKEEIHRARDFDDAVIKREIISAIRYYRGKRFFFNEGQAQMLTTAGQESYGPESATGEQDGYPADMLRPDRLRITINNSIYILDHKTIHHIRNVNTNPDTTGYPDWWAWYNKKFWLYPVANTDDWVIDIDYIKDIGTPYYTYTGGEWVFYDPGGNILDDSWTSDWLEYGEELIRFRAKWGIYMNVILDMEKAAIAKQAEKIAYDSLVQDRNNFIMTSEAIAWGY